MYQHLYRAGFIAAVAAMSYVALLPAYDFSEWIPVTLLQAAHIPRVWIEFFANHADKIAHMVGALIVTCLYYLSFDRDLPMSEITLSILRFRPAIFIGLLFLLALTAELAQLWIGRSFSVADIVAGVFGGCLALIFLNYSDILKYIGRAELKIPHSL